jgi:hypothetical protein
LNTIAAFELKRAIADGRAFQLHLLEVAPPCRGKFAARRDRSDPLRNAAAGGLLHSKVAPDEREAENGKQLLSGKVNPRQKLPEDRPNA